MNASVLRLRRENQAINTAAAIIRAHVPGAELFQFLGRPRSGFYVRSNGSPWDFLGRDAGCVAVARCIVEAEISARLAPPHDLTSPAPSTTTETANTPAHGGEFRAGDATPHAAPTKEQHDAFHSRSTRRSEGPQPVPSVADRFLDFVGEHLIGPFLVFLIILILAVPLGLLIASFFSEPRDYVAECRARCTASGLVMTGVEFGSKQQCKCEVAR